MNSTDSTSEKAPPQQNTGKFKAAILSGLVFPGLGQLAQKRYVMAAIIAGLSVLCFYLVFTEMLVATNAAAARMMESGTMDFTSLNAEAEQIVLNLDSPLFLVAGYSLIGLWIFSIVEIFKPLFKK